MPELGPTIHSVVEGNRLDDLLSDVNQEIGGRLDYCAEGLKERLSDAVRQAYREGVRDGFQQGAHAAKEQGKWTLPAPEESNLPSRVVVGANGAYWRDFTDDPELRAYSMCPVSSDNDPVEIMAVYERVPGA